MKSLQNSTLKTDFAPMGTFFFLLRVDIHKMDGNMKLTEVLPLSFFWASWYNRIGINVFYSIFLYHCNRFLPALKKRRFLDESHLEKNYLYKNANCAYSDYSVPMRTPVKAHGDIFYLKSGLRMS